MKACHEVRQTSFFQTILELFDVPHRISHIFDAQLGTICEEGGPLPLCSTKSVSKYHWSDEAVHPEFSS